MTIDLFVFVAFALLAGYAVAGLALQSIARRAGLDAIWAWLPPLVLLLPFQLAGRSLAWGVLLLLPPLNFVVWTLAWAEACDVLGKPRWLALGMPVPLVNLAVLGHLAGLPPLRQVASLVLVALAAGTAAGAQAARERRACRETLTALGDPDADVRRRAAEALVDEAAGCDAAAARGAALGALQEALADESLAVRGRAALSLSKVARAGSATGAAVLPPAVVPALLHLARGTGERLVPDVELVDALASLGPAAVAPLAEALQDPDSAVRWHAAGALLQLGPAARPATAALRTAMDDDAWVVRNAAGRALEEAAGEDDAPLLVDALADASAETRYHAARALGRLGPFAAPAVPALTQSLGDGDWEVRVESARALAAVGPEARAALPELIEALDDPEPQVRMTVVWSVAKLGAPQASAIEALQATLDDRDREVRAAAARALARRGGEP
ncbi:MAG TPA: HEAT repeat domain-containing protein [Vicinamibacteria bacterium]|nr:HEAT repeat domain-containing protein [Vicinamibacteria bacterium]